MMSLQSIGLIVVAYLVGSIPVAYLVGKYVKRIDLRHYGSGNLGASNVLIHMGKKWFVVCAGFDFLVKGMLIAILADWGFDLGASASLVCLAAVAGHNWSIYLRFSGGRGIATAIGILVILAWRELVILAIMGLIGRFLLRNTALLFFTGIVTLPLASLFFKEPLTVTIFTTGLLALTVLKRLAAGGDITAKDIPLTRLLLNRLLYDRDIRDNTSWLHRTPEGPK
jgi:glycerol-3-phosphate acyltransferase PlsY